MKTSWQIVESPHEDGALQAIRKSRFIHETLPDDFQIDAFPFTDRTFLVVVTVMKRKGKL